MEMVGEYQKNDSTYALTLAALSTLYFIFGFMTCLNDILVPHLKAMFDLNYAQAMLVQFSFFSAYFIMSLPSGWLVDRLNYRKGMVGGLLTASLGCLLFHPAAGARSYPLFLLALFVLASGITLLQVAANPYVAILGRPETSSSRLALTQAFNSLGTTLAPLFGSVLILGAAAPVAREAARAAEAASVQGAYLGLCGALLLLALLTAVLPMPLLNRPRERDQAGAGRLLGHRHLVLGAVGIFAYVGAEVAIGSFLVSYLSLPSVGGLSLAAAARLVSLYWGGAMVGRFLGAAAMRRVAPARILAGNAGAAMVLVLVAMTARGGLAMAAILAVGFCNSIMFPTIFTLAIRGLGQAMGRASGFLCVAIVGGALVPVLQGLAADAVGIRPAFSLSVLCYAYIVFYGVKGHVPVPRGDQP